jgi:hypothetical protein
MSEFERKRRFFKVKQAATFSPELEEKARSTNLTKKEVSFVSNLEKSIARLQRALHAVS